MIDFEKLEVTEIKNMRGGEGSVLANTFYDGRVRIMRATLKKGCSIGLHTHETSSEVIYALSGKAVLLEDGREIEFKPGDCHYCPKGCAHSIKNVLNEDFVMLAVIPEQ